MNVNGPGYDPDAITINAITINAITINAITINAITINALTLNPLTSASLSLDHPTGAALADPTTRQLYSYIVSCALPKGAEVTYTAADNQVYHFDGELGLAPEWGKPGGKCNEACQQWVSGCILARTDYLGQHVSISIRGQNPALTPTWQEMHAYPHREATYYGNIFSHPQRLLACLSPGQTGDPRVCGPSLASCGIEFQGSCDDACGAPRWDGSFPACHGPSDRNGHDTDKAYLGSVTTFLH